jgi:hypothetical protein
VNPTPLAQAAGRIVHARNKYLPPVVLNLPRGCGDTDEETGELLIRGQRGKGYDRTPLQDDMKDGNRPWVVAAPVHAAVGLLEELADGPLLFPPSPVCAHRTRPGEFNARQNHAMNVDISDFISWVNVGFTSPGTTAAIPADPCGPIYSRRFRRPWPTSSSVSPAA